MPLKLLYITNKPSIATIAQDAGVDIIFIDLEVLGKAERQGHLDSVKSTHSISDIAKVRRVVNKAKLLVRVNPINPNSKEEIEKVISAGADIVMLPMFKTADEVKSFVDYVDSRSQTMLLLETKEAVQNIDEIMKIKGINSFHIGLNDLHLAYKKSFMFELMIDGTVEYIIDKLKSCKYEYGIGGIARIGYGLVDSEYIINEHYRLGSSGAILSRSFCNADKIDDPKILRDIFARGIKDIRLHENKIRVYNSEDFENSRKILAKKISDVVNQLNGKI